MADSENQILIDNFTNQLNLVAQQGTSYFRGKILEEKVTGETFDHINLGTGSTKEVTSRYEDIEAVNPEFSKRGARIHTYYNAIFIDNDDQLKSLVDIKSGLAEAQVKAAMRKLDKVVAQAALGSILTGRNLTTEVTAANDGVQTVTAGSGLGYDELRKAVDLLRSTGAGMNEKVYCAITNKQESTLFDKLEVVSNDYNAGQAARTGILPPVLGAEFLVFPSSPNDAMNIINKSGNDYDCFLFTASALKLGMLDDFKVRYERRPDKVDTMQLVLTSRYAALRTEGAKIVKITSTEA